MLSGTVTQVFTGWMRFVSPNQQCTSPNSSAQGMAQEYMFVSEGIVTQDAFWNSWTCLKLLFVKSDQMSRLFGDSAHDVCRCQPHQCVVASSDVMFGRLLIAESERQRSDAVWYRDRRRNAVSVESQVRSPRPRCTQLHVSMLTPQVVELYWHWNYYT